MHACWIYASRSLMYQDRELEGSHASHDLYEALKGLCLPWTLRRFNHFRFSFTMDICTAIYAKDSSGSCRSQAIYPGPLFQQLLVQIVAAGFVPSTYLRHFNIAPNARRFR